MKRELQCTARSAYICLKQWILARNRKKKSNKQKGKSHKWLYWKKNKNNNNKNKIKQTKLEYDVFHLFCAIWSTKLHEHVLEDEPGVFFFLRRCRDELHDLMPFWSVLIFEKPFVSTSHIYAEYLHTKKICSRVLRGSWHITHCFWV